jgi:3-methyladenine DNA glycosylase Mpg
MHAQRQPEEFWSDTYRGRNIAVFNHGGGWLVYLDHVMQQRLLFATADAAVAWLKRAVESSDSLHSGARS